MLGPRDWWKNLRLDPWGGREVCSSSSIFGGGNTPREMNSQALHTVPPYPLLKILSLLGCLPVREVEKEPPSRLGMFYFVLSSCECQHKSPGFPDSLVSCLKIRVAINKKHLTDLKACPASTAL